MATNYPASSSDNLMSFAVGLASAARIFTSEQLARHHELTRYREPEKRAREWLAKHSDTFESSPGPHGEPWRRRLTTKAKRQLGLQFKTVNGASQRSFHWLRYGDVWISLSQFAGRPDVWIAEPEGQFDIAFRWMRLPWLLELQRTPITAKRWEEKWKARQKWYASKQWKEKPRVVLIDLTGQQIETIKPPQNTIRVMSIEALPRSLARLAQTRKTP